VSFEYQNAEAGLPGPAQVVENMGKTKRSVNCIKEGASDVPAAGENPGQPKEEQDPARATANVAAPQKGKPAGRACGRRGGYNHRPQMLGRPVTSTGERNATRARVAFRVSGAKLSWPFRVKGSMTPKCTCQSGCLAVVSNLPIKRLTRATQACNLRGQWHSGGPAWRPFPDEKAACAYRPLLTATVKSLARAERAHRPARKFRRIASFFRSRCAAGVPIGKALHEESTGQTESIQRTGGSSQGVPEQRLGKAELGHSSGD
jgi:hypothetical protein